LNLNKRLIAIRLLACAAFLAGCGKKPEPQAAPSAEPVSRSVAETLVSPPALPGDASSINTNAAPPAKTDVEVASEAMAQSRAMGMSMIVEQFYDKNGRVPKDLNELVAAKMLLKVPKAPPGMRYAIDPQSKRVVVVRQ
jgi:hypothetical protein